MGNLFSRPYSQVNLWSVAVVRQLSAFPTNFAISLPLPLMLKQFSKQVINISYLYGFLLSTEVPVSYLHMRTPEFALPGSTPSL